MKRLAFTLFLGGIALTAGCRPPFFFGAPAETYVLRAAVGETLPVVLWTDEANTLLLLADTIRLRGDGTGEHVRVVRLQPAHIRPAVDPRTSRTRFGYVVRGDRLEISYPCPSNANCIAPPHEIGLLTHDGFALQSLPGGFVHRRR